jgi:hypothetical protein
MTRAKPASPSTGASLAYILASGGDCRLLLDPDRMLNAYGCRPWPRPEAFTFASSTATSISDRGYEAAATAWRHLSQASRAGSAAAAFAQLTEQLRGGVRAAFELEGTGAEIIFSPSGTDSQLHALYVSEMTMGGPLTTIIVAANETGSGTVLATTGRHFAASTATGATVVKGAAIPGFSAETKHVAISARDGNGEPRAAAELDAAVAAAVAETAKAGGRAVVHAMDSSKFGRRCPSWACLRELQQAWPGRVQIVIDACQLRLSRQRLAHYLAHGCIVLITGSKFFTGPPFSGAVLVPPALAARMAEAATVPEGLKAYSNRNEWPDSWSGVRAALPAVPNTGPVLRWAAALTEMQHYFRVPAAYRQHALGAFGESVLGLLAAHPNLRVLPAESDPAIEGVDDGEMAIRTLFPFRVSRNGAALTVAQCITLHRALNADMADALAPFLTEAQRSVAEQRCHIGQPVALPQPGGATVGTLRLATGARVVSETWCEAGWDASLQNLRGEVDQIRIILEKLDLLIDHLDALPDLTAIPSLRAVQPADITAAAV